LFAFDAALGGYTNVVGVNVKTFEILIYTDTIADLQIIVFDYKITPLKVIVWVVENNVVSKL
jgi:hypothetical protein